MIGFHHSSHADVNLITDNLRDRYRDLFSILKELVQNADDACAGRLRFGIVPGHSESPLELLRGPGLVVVNDGVFRRSDYEAICSFGLNSKAGDAATIGKFGLGMKSVFHLCEAIFFIAEGDGCLYQELLSPWGKEFRPDWDLPEAQQCQLLAALRRDCLAAIQWNAEWTPFILCLPLRREAHLRLPDGELAKAIIEEYPGDSGRIIDLLRADDTGARLASVLPLLRSIYSIQIYLPTKDGEPELVNGSELEPNSSRPLRHPADGQSELGSVVRTGARRLRFVGSQRRVMTHSLAEIHESSAWPASWVRNERGRLYYAADKAQPHAAAIFGQDVPGALTIRWAVFLPIEEHDEKVPMNSDMGGYSLTLHGHFFVDAGRNGLYGLDQAASEGTSEVRGEAWVRRSWNRELAGGATLDLVIPALDRFSSELGLSDARASALARAITGSNFWEKWKRSVAANQKWVHTVNRGGCRWALVGRDPTLPIPRSPEADPGRPWRVFPLLEEFGARAVFFDSDATNLVANENELGCWDEEQIAHLLDSVSVGKVFSVTTDADYLAEFIEKLSINVCSSDPVQLALCNLLRRAAMAIGIQALRNVAARVQRIAALILPDRKIRIALRSIAVAEFLVQQPISALPWPKDLDAGEASSNPNLDDVEQLLRALAGSKDQSDARRQYAEDLLKHLPGEERRELLMRAGDLSILSAFDCHLGQRISVSANRIRDSYGQGTLFRTGQGTNDRERAGLAPLLQLVLPDEPLIVVNKELAELVLSNPAAELLPACDSRGVLQCLAHQARRLGEPCVRGDLLRQVRLADRDPIAVRGMRFLLHGEPKHHDGSEPLWVAQGERSSEWRKVWEAAIPPAERWTVVDETLAAQLPNADWAPINLHAIVAEEVVQLVAQTGCEKLDTLRLDSIGYDAILAHEKWDECTWRSLPFHPTTAGKRVAIGGDNAYLEQPGMPFPEQLTARTNVILRSQDPRLAALQEQRIPKLDHKAAILIAIEDDKPDLWCDFILDWLANVSLSGDLIRALSDKPWLRMKSGPAVKPDDFIILPELENQITSIAQQSKVFGTLSLLPQELREHPVFKQLRDDLFPQSNSLAALARMAASSTTLVIGEPVIERDDLREVAGLLRNAPEECCSKGWAIVFAVCEIYGAEEGTRILKAIQGPVSIDCTKTVLEWLCGRSSDPGADKAFLGYLRLLGKATRDRKVLRDLRLCAQDGSWRPVGDLCYDVPGAAKGVLLSREQSEVLKEILESNQGLPLRSAASTKTRGKECSVEEYFAPWLRRGLKAQVGALVTMITGRTPLRNYAADLLLPHTREWLLSEIPWGPGELHGRTPEEAFERYSFVVYVVDESSEISTISLLGEPLQVPAERNWSHLLNGAPDRPGLYPKTKLYFRKIDTSDFSDAELSSILRVTGEMLLRFLYNRPSSLQKVWSRLDSMDQFHIATAERLILDYLPFYLGQLGIQNAPRLMEQLRKVDDGRRLVVEYEGRPEVEQKKKEYEACREELRKMLKRDLKAQEAVLEAVRVKLRDSQYQLSSIPFELFQNADDAYVQLREIGLVTGLPETESKNRFVVVNTTEAISFLHWGRSINSMGSHGFDGRQHGYHRDLEKMLTLSSSEKQIAFDGRSAPVTGRFGLGFKSVLLACDRPLILSGSLEVEIVGGVLPRALSATGAQALQAQTLRKQIEDFGERASGPGTAVQLSEIKEDIRGQVLPEFLKYAAYLTAFGLAIREIIYIDKSGRHTAVWAGRAVAGTDAIQRGTIPASGLTAADVMDAIRFQLVRGSVLFGLGPNGIRPLPKGTPAIWVTGPTREVEQFGFAVTAMFDLDPGRARLSTNERNARLAEELGKQLGDLLRTLRRTGWEWVRRDLNLASETIEYELWKSIWSMWQRTVTLPDSAAHRIMYALLKAALREIAGDIAVIPNGLPDELRKLTTGRSVLYKLTGVLSVEGCAKSVFSWPVWKQRGYTPEMIVSSEIAESLTKLGFRDLPSVNLSTVTSWLSGQTLRAPDALAGGELIKALPRQEERTHEFNCDLEGAKKALGNVWFYSQAKTRECPGDLVASLAKGEEGRRAAFAPANRRLADDYDETAVEFFRFCRGPMNVRVGELAQWARQAEGVRARRSALEYLLTGERAADMQRDLREAGTRGTWLASRSEVEVVAPELLDELRRPPLEEPEPGPWGRPAPRIGNPRAILERIEEWWRRDGPEKLPIYDQTFYPHARIPRLIAPWEPGFDRSEWLVLFGRAAFYKMGRLNDNQHRTFIEHAQRERYWDVFSAADPQRRADEWMNVLENFCDAQIDAQIWEYWMRSFLDLYKLSRWLEDYVEMFLGLDRQEGRYELDAVLKPRSDPGQQGGGIDAPPPGLGIGACFVIRELLRHGHIRNANANEHAFVPTGAVRRLMDYIGLEVDQEASVKVSAQIYGQLAAYLSSQRATFGGAYDIPFQILSTDAALQNELLR